MHWISPDQISPRFQALFSTDMPIGLRCFAILNGVATGRILTDNPESPSVAIVQELGDGAIFLGGKVTRSNLSEAISSLRQEKEVLIGVWPDDPKLGLVSSIHPDYAGASIDFTNRTVGQGLDSFLNVPQGCQLQSIDMDIFPYLANYTWAVPVFGSAERALEKGLGFCLMQKDEVLSEAFAGPDANGVIEIGVETPEPYRRQGFATLVSAHLIQVCEAKGYQTFWNTAKQNYASIALARKLGYRAEREFKVFAWSKEGHPA